MSRRPVSAADSRGRAPRADVARERRRGRPVGVVTLAGIGAMFAATAISARAARVVDGDAGELLARYVERDGAQLVAAALRAGGELTMIVLALFLHRVIRARDPGASGVPVWAGIVGSAMLAASVIVGHAAILDVADAFVRTGPETEERADALIEESGSLLAIRWVDVAARIALAVWLVGAARSAYRLGLTGGIVALVGMAGGILGIVAPLGDALRVAWIGTIALLALGFWPGGRPAAWDAGRAVEPRYPT